MKYLIFLIGLIGLTSCLEEPEANISCGINFDPALLDNPTPSDSIFMTVRSPELTELNFTVLGILDEELSDSLGADTYANQFLRFRQGVNTLEELNGVGTELLDQSDSSRVTISFDFIERSLGDQACRFNKTVREEHFYSIWPKNKEGSRIDIVVKDGESDRLFTTDYEHENDDDFRVNITNVEILDDAKFFARLRGTFTARVKDTSSDSNPVSVSGEFQYIAQISYGITP